MTGFGLLEIVVKGFFILILSKGFGRFGFGGLFWLWLEHCVDKDRARK